MVSVRITTALSAHLSSLASTGGVASGTLLGHFSPALDSWIVLEYVPHRNSPVPTSDSSWPDEATTSLASDANAVAALSTGGLTSVGAYILCSSSLAASVPAKKVAAAIAAAVAPTSIAPPPGALALVVPSNAVKDAKVTLSDADAGTTEVEWVNFTPVPAACSVTSGSTDSASRADKPLPPARDCYTVLTARFLIDEALTVTLPAPSTSTSASSSSAAAAASGSKSGSASVPPSAVLTPADVAAHLEAPLLAMARAEAARFSAKLVGIPKFADEIPTTTTTTNTSDAAANTGAESSGDSSQNSSSKEDSSKGEARAITHALLPYATICDNAIIDIIGPDAPTSTPEPPAVSAEAAAAAAAAAAAGRGECAAAVAAAAMPPAVPVVLFVQDRPLDVLAAATAFANVAARSASAKAGASKGDTSKGNASKGDKSKALVPSSPSKGDASKGDTVTVVLHICMSVEARAATCAAAPVSEALAALRGDAAESVLRRCRELGAELAGYLFLKAKEAGKAAAAAKLAREEAEAEAAPASRGGPIARSRSTPATAAAAAAAAAAASGVGMGVVALRCAPARRLWLRLASSSSPPSSAPSSSSSSSSMLSSSKGDSQSAVSTTSAPVLVLSTLVPSPSLPSGAPAAAATALAAATARAAEAAMSAAAATLGRKLATPPSTAAAAGALAEGEKFGKSQEFLRTTVQATESTTAVVPGAGAGKRKGKKPQLICGPYVIIGIAAAFGAIFSALLLHFLPSLGIKTGPGSLIQLGT